MSLTLRPDSQWWYGKYTLPSGKPVVKNLGVVVRGIRPKTLRQQGDAEFEASRNAAEEKFKEILDGVEKSTAAIKLARSVVEYHTAEKHVSPLIGKLPDQWLTDHNISKKEDGDVVHYKGRSDSHVSHSQGALRRLARFFKENHPSVARMAAVSKDQLRAFLETIEQEGLGPRTWNYHLKLLREMFRRHEPDSSACRYLHEVEEKDEATKHRKPFTEEQLRAIFKAAQKDDFIRPVVVLGLNTPLRLGDCCTLKWDDVDLSIDYLTVRRTSKTKKGVQIPVWEELKAELAKHPRTGKYVLPDQAQMYGDDPTGINSKLRAVFAAAGIPVFQRKRKGQTNDQQEHEAGPTDDREKLDEKKEDEKDGEVTDAHKQTAKGPRNVNEQAFQAFRVTWVTRALNRGVPLALVRKATAHTTVEIVLEHYYHPAKEEMRDALAAAKPELGSAPAKRPEKEVVEILHKMTAKTWRRDQARLIKLCGELWPANHLGVSKDLMHRTKPRGGAPSK